MLEKVTSNDDRDRAKGQGITRAAAMELQHLG